MTHRPTRSGRSRLPSQPGFFFLLLCAHLALAAPDPATLRGQIFDAETGAPLADAWLVLRPASGGAAVRAPADSAGHFRLEALAPGPWIAEVAAYGYRPERRPLELPLDQALVFRLAPRPLLMDEMVVRTRLPGQDRRAPAFVEQIAPDQQGPGADLPALLAGATSVHIRRQGGLGSFSTLSIRGSTSEQVLVFLDGVPLNQALGGPVDLGTLPLAGVESVEIYRGAVPARFGGNSMGGVVHLRTRQAGGPSFTRLRAATGSFATRHLGLSAGGSWQGLALMGLLDYQSSRNDFRFFDDNGTEYNGADDAWARRRNSDFAGLRALLKATRPWGESRLRVHSTLDLSHRGIPGLGHNPSLHTRFDTWRHLWEAELFGPLGAGGRAGYRLSAHHLFQQEEYKDRLGEVGTGTQHERNRTRSLGLRAEASILLSGRALLTPFARLHQERFAPEDLLRSASRMLASRRLAATLGAEAELPLAGERLALSAGTQAEVVADRFRGQKNFADLVQPERRHVQLLPGWRLGARLALARGWSVQGHRGFYRRAPGFFELFGDRGAVLGNTDLKSEAGRTWDAGLLYQAEQEGTLLRHAEFALFHSEVEDLIRFAQTSQQVSKPHNIGRARLRGAEMRARVRLLPRLLMTCNYTHQRAENRSPFAYERGNDLPSAPRHDLNASLALSLSPLVLRYELSYESRHFLDRANLRPVPARRVHTAGASLDLRQGASLSLEVRNLGNARVHDLWGYPLPGRAFFLSLTQDLRAP